MEAWPSGWGRQGGDRLRWEAGPQCYQVWCTCSRSWLGLIRRLVTCHNKDWLIRSCAAGAPAAPFHGRDPGDQGRCVFQDGAPLHTWRRDTKRKLHVSQVEAGTAQLH